MTLGIIIPLVVLPIALVVAWRWYSRSVRTTTTSAGVDERRQVSGVRLTSEALHRLTSPPWRVVHEIGDQLPGIDHVVVGPAGIVAVQTRVGDRPTVDQVRAATAHQRNALADAVLVRAPLDELLTPLSLRAALLARVYWGAADTDRPAAETAIDTVPVVEGQRLTAWLDELAAGSPSSLEPALDAARVDAAWRVVVMGIGRPDPRGALG